MQKFENKIISNPKQEANNFLKIIEVCYFAFNNLL